MPLHTPMLAASISLAAAAPAVADMLDTSGMAAWESCALCHGADGLSATPRFPKLAGQKPAYLRRQLLAFRSGARDNDGGQMATMAGEVTNETIDTLIDHFAQLPPPPPPVSGDGDIDAGLGESLFRHGRDGVPACAGCHDDAGSTAPWLFGQHAGYLRKQLTDFASGARRGGTPMPAIARALYAREIDALAGYLQGRSRTPSAEEKSLENSTNLKIVPVVITSYDEYFHAEGKHAEGKHAEEKPAEEKRGLSNHRATEADRTPTQDE